MESWHVFTVVLAILVIAMVFWMFSSLRSWVEERGRFHKKQMRLWAFWEWFV